MPHDLLAHDVEISTFDHAWDTAPKAVRCSVGGLVRALSTFPVFPVADKRALPAWSPAIYAPGAPRRADTVRAVSCLVLDVDNGDPDAAFEPWAGSLAVMHTTWSHRPEAPRFRLVLPLARPVPSDRWASPGPGQRRAPTGPTRRARTRRGCTSAPRGPPSTRPTRPACRPARCST